MPNPLPMKARDTAKIVASEKKQVKLPRFKCRVCGGGKFYTDPAKPSVRRCIPCENKMEARLEAKRKRYEDAHPQPKRKRPTPAKNTEYVRKYRAKKKAT